MAAVGGQPPAPPPRAPNGAAGGDVMVPGNLDVNGALVPAPAQAPAPAPAQAPAPAPAHPIFDFDDIDEGLQGGPLRKSTAGPYFSLN